MREVDQNDKCEARKILLSEFAIAADIAWAWEILLNRAYRNDEERYKRIHDKDKFINSLGLATRYEDGSPAYERKGVSVQGVDLRDTQYLHVKDVVKSIKEANFDDISFIDLLEEDRKKVGRPRKLSLKKVGEIQRLHIEEPNLTSEEIAKRYCVSPELIRLNWN